MRVTLDRVSKGKNGTVLPETTLDYSTGRVRFAVAETEQRPTVLGLIASGRMTPDSGRVLLGDAEDAKALRRRVALIDAPEVSDPHPGVTLAAVVGEELMFAGRPATPIHARRWLTQVGYADAANQPISTIPPHARVRILCELAILREGVDALVLVHPDRHGGNPDGWARIAGEFAERGYAVLVIVGGSAAVAIERMPDADTVPLADASAAVDAAQIENASPVTESDAFSIRSTTEQIENAPEEPAVDAFLIRDDETDHARGTEEDA